MDRTYYRTLDTKELIEKANEIGGEIVIALAERLADIVEDNLRSELEDDLRNENDDLLEILVDLKDEFEDHLSEKDELLAQISDLMDEISQLQNTILKIEEDTEQ